MMAAPAPGGREGQGLDGAVEEQGPRPSLLEQRPWLKDILDDDTNKDGEDEIGATAMDPNLLKRLAGRGPPKNQMEKRKRSAAARKKLRPHWFRVDVDVKASLNMSVLSRLPRRWRHSLTPVDGDRLVVFGGLTVPDKFPRGESALATRVSNDLFVFNTVTLTWSSVQWSGIAPSPRDGHTAAYIKGQLIIFGGMGSRHFNDVSSLDIKTMTWSPANAGGMSHPCPRSGHSVSVNGSYMYIFGGCAGGSAFLNDVWRLDVDTMEWTQIRVNSQPPAPRSEGTLRFIKDGDGCRTSMLLLYGGHDSENAYSDVWTFDLLRHVWEKRNPIGTPPQPKFDHSSILNGDLLYVFGGATHGSGPNTDKLALDVDVLDVANMAWWKPECTGKPPIPRTGFGVAMVDESSVIVYGGHDGTSGVNTVNVLNLLGAGHPVAENAAWTDSEDESSAVGEGGEMVEGSRGAREHVFDRWAEKIWKKMRKIEIENTTLTEKLRVTSISLEQRELETQLLKERVASLEEEKANAEERARDFEHKYGKSVDALTRVRAFMSSLKNLDEMPPPQYNENVGGEKIAQVLPDDVTEVEAVPRRQIKVKKRGLLSIVRRKKTIFTPEDDVRAILFKTEWLKYSKNPKATLPSGVIFNALKKCQLRISPEYLTRLLRECDVGKTGHLSLWNALRVLNAIQSTHSMNNLFKYYGNQEIWMSLDNFFKFLRHEQRETGASLATVKELVSIHMRMEHADRLHRCGFAEYLLSNDNTAIQLTRSQVYQDMEQPLTHYFISASYKTYLRRDQLRGNSSARMYETVLRQGARFIEIDCWDGETGEPDVYSGGTLTSRVPVREILQTVGRNAFAASEFPLIVAMYVHCSHEQQAVLSELIMSELGAHLAGPLARYNSGMPSPASLRNKILLAFGFDDGSQGSRQLSPGQELQSLGGDLRSIMSLQLTSDGAAPGSGSAGTPRVDGVGVIEEGSAVKSLSTHPEETVQHTCVQLSYCIPDRNRIDSSNPSPGPLWSCGVQLVGMNFQTADPAMWTYQGLFRDNGNCGYILKPPILTNMELNFDPRTYSNNMKTLFQVTAISAHQLPSIPNPDKPIEGLPYERELFSNDVNPFLKVEIIGIPSDCRAFRTRTCARNGFAPEWDETFEFPLNVMEMALLRLVVMHSDDDDADSEGHFIGQAVIPVRSIRLGYRNVALRDALGAYIPNSKLLLRFRASDNVPLNVVGTNNHTLHPELVNPM